MTIVAHWPYEAWHRFEDGARLRELGFNSNGGVYPLELGLTLGARFEFEWYLCP